ncbi:P-loop containing nucleoside triphosphate hydrolase protein [Rhizoctonia solani]|nr:P-loop containing nucleoside triphosphate hydrolase protein [Rhizoctonia solani]
MSVSTSGRWPVVLSGRARGELRLLAEDKRTWDMIRKKLRELSHGQFTTDNYLPVRGSTHYIPIYRARLGNDLRIIYRIDLESDGYNNYDQQIIRVLAVRSRARVAYDFWFKVSKFLRRRGSEYRKRCIRRDTLDTKDGCVYVPASFPHKEYNSLADPDPESEDVNLPWEESEMSELHETVVLEKYIPITKSLYNSILADMDTVLPIILNPDEKAIVRYQSTSVVIGRSGTGKTTALVYKMRANALAAGISDHPGPLRQLFVTRSPVLTRRVASYYKGLIESGEMAHRSSEELRAMRESNQKDQPRDILEFDNEADLRDDLPDRYSELRENHFPLFISFDRLGQLLEADALGTDDALALARNKRKRLISFSTFKHHYWPSFNYNLTRRLDPALVFSEILGVIKGYGHGLTEDEYLNGLSTKKSPLLANVRREVYAIFQEYQERCSTRGETDTADRVKAILSARKDGTNIGSRVDYLFVDEVQDQLMADIYLLQSLCSNVDGGYWCGDTAQTINIGSSFRIKDMKAYLYGEMVSGASSAPQGFRRKVAAPFSTFELTVNFRSHSGIVKYAASLVQLLYTLFPGSIDHMKPESAPIPGPKPLVFISPLWDEDQFVEYLLDGKLIDQCPPFDPEQAIIVRSEATAHSLRVKLQNRCNVLTLFECKGLEFDDLILYGFFTESDVSFSAWKMIATLEPYQENGNTRYLKPSDLTLVSPGLCSELKQLYVAVTRARHHCWLWDSGPTVEMMKDFWQKSGLIKLSDSMETLGLFPGASDDPRQWAQRGEGFFSNGLYAIAQTCFERAGREKDAQIADAYNHMSEAGKLQEDSSAARSAQIVAAEKMIVCTKLHSSHSTATLWYHAATCFEAAKDIARASHAYVEGKFYDRAVLVYFEAQDMPRCLDVILLYSAHIDVALLRRIKEVASVHFLRQHDYRRLKQLHNGDLGECIEIARSLRFKAQLKELLQMAQQFEDLATEYLSDGSPVEAVSCLVYRSRTPSAIQRSKDIISVFLWANFGLSDTPGSKAISQANLLLKICNSQDALSDSEGSQDALSV